MNGIMLGMLAETPIHPGAGQSMGAIDNPVAREATTDYPVLAGSGVKGALRDRAKQDGIANLERLYGQPDRGGSLVVSDGRLLLLPVRSLTSAYRWVTCPHLLERLQRDGARLGSRQRQPLTYPASWMIEGLPVAVVFTEPPSRLFLEEQVFRPQSDPTLIEAVVTLLQDLVGDAEAKGRLRAQLTIVSDDAFAEFARYALPVDAHNKLDENKISRALWYEETIPPDTVMYALVLGAAAKDHFDDLFFGQGRRPYLQLGGNETTGQGWFRLAKAA